ncbi:YkgJ family cysteine cluster protein [Nanoarchaeota archaeon]
MGNIGKLEQLNELIDTWKEDVLSKFCDECNGYCCGSNIFNLKEEQVKLIFDVDDIDNVPENDYKHPIFEKFEGDLYRTDYASNERCPKWDEGLCKIYENPLRPDVCKEYPIFIENNSVYIMNFPCTEVTSLENIGGLCLNVMDLGYQIQYANGLDREITKEKISDAFYDKKRREKFMERLKTK